MNNRDHMPPGNRAKKLLWWGITAAYLCTNYLTLGSMPRVWGRINGMLGGEGIWFQYTLYSASAIALLVYLYRRGFLNTARHMIFTCGFILLFCVMFYLEHNPGEKIHMFQYGIFGLLLSMPLAMDLPAWSPRFCITGSIICFVAGAVDECIQGILPNRTFSWQDVFINGISGILVLIFISYFSGTFRMNREDSGIP